MDEDEVDFSPPSPINPDPLLDPPARVRAPTAAASAPNVIAPSHNRTLTRQGSAAHRQFSQPTEPTTSHAPGSSTAAQTSTQDKGKQKEADPVAQEAVVPNFGVPPEGYPKSNKESMLYLERCMSTLRVNVTALGSRMNQQRTEQLQSNSSIELQLAKISSHIESIDRTILNGDYEGDDSGVRGMGAVDSSAISEMLNSAVDRMLAGVDNRIAATDTDNDRPNAKRPRTDSGPTARSPVPPAAPPPPPAPQWLETRVPAAAPPPALQNQYRPVSGPSRAPAVPPAAGPSRVAAVPLPTASSSRVAVPPPPASTPVSVTIGPVSWTSNPGADLRGMIRLMPRSKSVRPPMSVSPTADADYACARYGDRRLAENFVREWRAGPVEGMESVTAIIDRE